MDGRYIRTLEAQMENAHMDVKHITVQIEKMYNDIVVPEYSNFGDSGMDIRAYFTQEFMDSYKKRVHKDGKGVWIESMDTALIPTGIKVAIPYGYEIQVRPRSGLALKQQLTILNSPGTLDSGYRGQISCIVTNLSHEDRLVNHGDRIAQIVLQRVPRIEWEVVDELDDTPRGKGGFGSSGVK